MGDSLTRAATPARRCWRTHPRALAALLAVLPNACVVVSGDAKDSSAAAVAVVDLDSAKRADRAPPDSAAAARAALQLARDSAALQRMSDSVRKAMEMDSIPPITPSGRGCVFFTSAKRAWTSCAMLGVKAWTLAITSQPTPFSPL